MYNYESDELKSKFQMDILQLQCDTALQNKAPQTDVNGNCSASVCTVGKHIFMRVFRA